MYSIRFIRFISIIILTRISFCCADTGRVKNYYADFEFGIITPDNSDYDMFIPSSVVVEAGLTKLEQGQLITYQSVPGPDDLAFNIVTKIIQN